MVQIERIGQFEIGMTCVSWATSTISRLSGRWGSRNGQEFPKDFFGKCSPSRPTTRMCSQPTTIRYAKTSSGDGLALFAANVGQEYKPESFGNWLQSRIPEWAKATGHHHATPHVFRKTALQHARHGEDVNQLVAQDAKVTTSVMMRHYVNEHDEELCHASNRSYVRILRSLPLDIATRYGYQPVNGTADLEARLEAATKAKDWSLVADLANRLSKDRPATPV